MDAGDRGESCEKPTTFTLKELKEKFTHHTLQMVLECAGNGRSEFNPPATGNQWTTGGVGCAKWTGIRLADVLKHCGIKKDAVYIGYYGADAHLSGDPKKSAISRGVPIQKALEDESLLVFAMNGDDIPIQNGHPLRLMFGGWAASTCGKWVKKIVIRDREHDGEKMTGHSYRMPRYPVAPGHEGAAGGHGGHRRDAGEIAHHLPEVRHHASDRGQARRARSSLGRRRSRGIGGSLHRLRHHLAESAARQTGESLCMAAVAH
jgi:DMSO/TMAO reductase YedYZ molybdopterin-dependent catalytic subunit